jgi:hypothetical protein
MVPSPMHIPGKATLRKKLAETTVPGRILLQLRPEFRRLVTRA